MTNSISIPFPTSVPDIYATKNAVPLAERFFSCPHAAKLLDSERFIKPILIDTQNISHPETSLKLESDDNFIKFLNATIAIPEIHLHTNKALSDLAFEIFNIQRTASDLYQQANLGNVTMDSYARHKEEHETSDTQEHYELIKQCGKHWTMSPEELKEYTHFENKPLEVNLFTQEIYCHTDFYRQEWVELFQKIYCEKHPADNRSCETKMTDLCNLEILGSMSDSKRTKFIRERICKLFPQAHVAVKNDPDVRGIIRENCPEVLEKSSPQSIQEEL